MDAVSSKSKRSMRVATVFTGIGACTAGMTYGATAQAATHTTVKHTPIHTGFTVKPAGRSSGHIQEVRSCGSNTWLHVVSEVKSGSFCFGFSGTFIPTDETGMIAQCGGNNFGWLSSGYSPNFNFTLFRQGSTYRRLSWPHLTHVHISGWRGSDKCYAAF